MFAQRLAQAFAECAGDTIERNDGLFIGDNAEPSPCTVQYGMEKPEIYIIVDNVEYTFGLIATEKIGE